MEIITSRNNDRIKSAAALIKAPARNESGLFLLEGARLCADAAKSGTEIKELFISEKAAEKYKNEASVLFDCAGKSFFITDSVADKLSDTGNSQQVFCVCAMKRTEPVLSDSGFYIMTENIQTPDNLGAVARSAEALGADGLIVCGGTDIYNPKAQRAAMGALIRLPVVQTDDAPQFIRECNARSMKTYAAVASGADCDIISSDKLGGAVAVIGNEGNGVSEETKNACSYRVTIPMKGRAESLNAAAAAAIVIWEFMRQR